MTTQDLVPHDGGMEPYQAPAVPVIAGTRPRLPEVGRIRLGDEKTDPKRPGVKLGTFRFTSRDRSLVERVAEVYGGTPKPWNSDEGPQWQVVSEEQSIPVVVPRADLAFSQFYELWSGGGCQRRCNGVRDFVRDCPCTCDLEHPTCKPTTRLSVMLPGVRGMGLWRVESHGDNARSEILGSIELAAAYGAALVPARLVLAQRTGRQPNPKKPGEFVKTHYVVPLLVIDDSIEEYMDRARQIQARELGLLPSGADLAGPATMRKLRAAVFSLWPESADPGPERDRRLRQLSLMLGRDIATISNDHDLTESEARRLASMVNDLHEDTQPAPARELSAPALSADPSGTSGAESTAPQSSAAGSPTATPDKGGASSEPAAEQSSAGRAVPSPSGAVQATDQGQSQPAEHPSDAPGAVEKTKPDMPAAGEGRSGASAPDQWDRQRREQIVRERLTESWMQAAETACRKDHEAHPFPCEWHIQAAEEEMKEANKPKPLAPTRKRPGKPNMDKARENLAEMRHQSATWNAPSNWLHTLLPADRNAALEAYGSPSSAHKRIQEIVSQEWPNLADLRTWADREWNPTALGVLMATIEAEKGTQQ
jgi:Recombination directionality factor-like